jgi:hypothetical protein
MAVTSRKREARSAFFRSLSSKITCIEEDKNIQENTTSGAEELIYLEVFN